MVAQEMLHDKDFGFQLDTKLSGQDTIIAKAKKLGTDDEKIACIFNSVKRLMNWNKRDNWFTVNGVK